MMGQTRQTYKAGDWVALPVHGKFAVGILARVNNDGICVGYFFAELYDEPPPLEVLLALRPQDSILIHRFVGPYLKNGRWSIIGHDSEWTPSKWPLPAFRHKDSVSGRWHIREYADDHAMWITSDRLATETDVEHLPEDGCADAKYIELRIEGLLGVPSGIRRHAAMVDPPQHYVYFRDKQSADHAATAYREFGYDPVFSESADEHKPWLLLVRHKRVTATDAEMERAGEPLAAIAAEWGGEYDGWDRPS